MIPPYPRLVFRIGFAKPWYTTALLIPYLSGSPSPNGLMPRPYVPTYPTTAIETANNDKRVSASCGKSQIVSN